MKFRDRKRLGRFRRRVREAEERVNLAIIKRMQELRKDAAFMAELDSVVEEDAAHMREMGMQGYANHVSASIKKSKEDTI